MARDYELIRRISSGVIYHVGAVGRPRRARAQPLGAWVGALTLVSPNRHW